MVNNEGKKMSEFYDDILNEWMSSYTKHGALKTASISGAVAGVTASTLGRFRLDCLIIGCCCVSYWIWTCLACR